MWPQPGGRFAPTLAAAEVRIPPFSPAGLAPHGATALAVLACAGAVVAARPMPAPQPAPVPAATAPETVPDMAALAALHLFGTPPQAPSLRTAPPAPLALTLAGVLHAEDPQRARALLAGPDGTQRPYAAGDELPGGARLVAISGHGVRVAAAGGEQELTLPEVGARDPVARRSQPVPGHAPEDD